MLKTLKLTSLFAVIAAGLAVVILIIFGFKGNPEVSKLIGSPGVKERFKDTKGKADKKDDITSPLVVQARAFALRIDPPPPPAPPKPKDSQKSKTPATARKTPVKLPTLPKVPVAPKSDLLATVMYKSSPEKSLALFKAGSAQEWFRQGDRVGNHVIKEIRDGSVILTQGEKTLPEEFVPAKPTVKSILKGEQASSAVSRPGTVGAPGWPSIPPSSRPSAPVDTRADSQADSGRSVTVGAGNARPSVPTSSTQPGASGRIQRVRSVPRTPTPVEQKESLDGTISGIQDIMKSQKDAAPADKELWESMLKILKAEQEQLDAESKIQKSKSKADTQRQKPEADETSQDNDQSDSREDTKRQKPEADEASQDQDQSDSGKTSKP